MLSGRRLKTLTLAIVTVFWVATGSAISPASLAVMATSPRTPNSVTRAAEIILSTQYRKLLDLQLELGN